MPTGDIPSTTSPTGAAGTRATLPIVFLLDCDNTLLDNDALKDDLDARLRALLGPSLAERFWEVYEEVREETGVVDLPLTFTRFAPLCPSPEVAQQVESTFMDYPFPERLYPEALATLAYLRTIGEPVILSDGDTVYQPRKITASGIAAAVDEQVMIVDHKENYIGEVMRRWPASFYVVVDDKGRILAALKAALPDRFVTVQVMQGHYAQSEYLPAPDIRIEDIGELRRYTPADLARHLGAPAR